MITPIPPTRVQRDALLIIQELYDTTGAMPSYRELARELDCNVSSAYRVVGCLSDRGWLRRQLGGARSFQILHRLDVALEEIEIEVTALGRDFRGDGDLRAIRKEYDRATEAAIQAAEKAR